MSASVLSIKYTFYIIICGSELTGKMASSYRSIHAKQHFSVSPLFFSGILLTSVSLSAGSITASLSSLLLLFLKKTNIS